MLILFKFYHVARSVISCVILSEHKFSTSGNKKRGEIPPNAMDTMISRRKIIRKKAVTRGPLRFTI